MADYFAMLFVMLMLVFAWVGVIAAVVLGFGWLTKKLGEPSVHK
jgi:hypothetical protein